MYHPPCLPLERHGACQCITEVLPFDGLSTASLHLSISLDRSTYKSLGYSWITNASNDLSLHYQHPENSFTPFSTSPTLVLPIFTYQHLPPESFFNVFVKSFSFCYFHPYYFLCRYFHALPPLLPHLYPIVDSFWQQDALPILIIVEPLRIDTSIPIELIRSTKSSERFFTNLSHRTIPISPRIFVLIKLPNLTRYNLTSTL